MTYLRIILLDLPAFMILQVYASTMRECGETVVPMKAGAAAVAVNLIFNYLLIYGKFGFPGWGWRERLWQRCFRVIRKRRSS